uniref:MULE transposase domain-containing protein n=1 Tax=Lactuca sativa TaxID=4236 RepID=A0A9R1V9R8_LACSA|nr:hypothetical protein LSAT_V11C600306090 [Lactuca sativa]
MSAKVSKTFNFIASVGQCRNAKRYAFKEIEGTLKEHYAKTWSYGEELRRTNPGSIVKVDVDVMPDGITYLLKFYICLKIKVCRRVIGLDVCFLKGICRGQLLAAVDRDANNRIYPLSWAVVAVESKETWKWFVDLLLDDIGMENGHGLTLISDQHKGLLEAVKERVSAVEHRQCARHICANFMKKFKGQQFSKLFWYVATFTTHAKFEQHMNEIKKLEPLAYDHLMERDPKTWSKAFFQTDKACDAYENGVSKSFNLVIDAIRKRPLITMLEEIRIYKSKGSSWGDLNKCPAIRLKLSMIKELQRLVSLESNWLPVCMDMLPFQASIGIQRTMYHHGGPQQCFVMTICTPLSHLMEDHKKKRDQIENELKGNKHTISKRASKVKVQLVQEIDVESDSDSEVQREPDNKVESDEVDLQDDNHRYEDVDQPDVEVEVQGQGQCVVGGVEEQVEVEVQGHGECLDSEDQVAVVDQVEAHVVVEGGGQEGEEHAIVQDPIGQDDQGQAVVQDPVEEELMQKLLAFQVLQGKRRRKPSERITKIQIRKKWEGKQGSSGENLFELE